MIKPSKYVTDTVLCVSMNFLPFYSHIKQKETDDEVKRSNTKEKHDKNVTTKHVQKGMHSGITSHEGHNYHWSSDLIRESLPKSYNYEFHSYSLIKD